MTEPITTSPFGTNEQASALMEQYKLSALDFTVVNGRTIILWKKHWEGLYNAAVLPHGYQTRDVLIALAGDVGPLRIPERHVFRLLLAHAIANDTDPHEQARLLSEDIIDIAAQQGITLTTGEILEAGVAAKKIRVDRDAEDSARATLRQYMERCGREKAGELMESVLGKARK